MPVFIFGWTAPLNLKDVIKKKAILRLWSVCFYVFLQRPVACQHIILIYYLFSFARSLHFHEKETISCDDCAHGMHFVFPFFTWQSFQVQTCDESGSRRCFLYRALRGSVSVGTDWLRQVCHKVSFGKDWQLLREGRTALASSVYHTRCGWEWLFPWPVLFSPNNE